MLLAIALGGAVGSVARYLLSGLLQRPDASFPYATLLVNVTGSCLLGFLVRYFAGGTLSPELRAALTVGFCGGYTTFSTFGYETVAMLERGAYARAAAYTSASVVLSLLGTYGGIVAARTALAAPR